MGIIKWVDKLPKLVKILLALPALDFVWAIYRIIKGVCKGHLITLVFGIVWLVGAVTIGWILDMIWLFLFDKVLFGD